MTDKLISCVECYLAHREFYWLFDVRRRAQPRDLLPTANCLPEKHLSLTSLAPYVP